MNVKQVSDRLTIEVVLLLELQALAEEQGPLSSSDLSEVAEQRLKRAASQVVAEKKKGLRSDRPEL